LITGIKINVRCSQGKEPKGELRLLIRQSFEIIITSYSAEIEQVAGESLMGSIPQKDRLLAKFKLLK
jgi:hypothetical protein